MRDWWIVRHPCRNSLCERARRRETICDCLEREQGQLTDSALSLRRAEVGEPLLGLLNALGVGFAVDDVAVNVKGVAALA